MITEQNLSRIREMLAKAENPLIFYDDDADGVSSFLLCRKFKDAGHGVIINSTPRVSRQYLKQVRQYTPDLIVILDLAEVDQEFIDGCTCPILWVDHHEIQPRKNVIYFNPLQEEPKDNRPVTYWIYMALGGPIWIATLGAVGDWTFPEFVEKFKEEYPMLLEKKVDSPEEALYHSSFSKLFNIYSFNFKGTARSAMQSIQWLTKIDNPYDILEKKTKEGRQLYEKYEKINAEYVELLATVKPIGEKMLFFSYVEKVYAFTSDISNYLAAHNPDKFIMVCRKKGDRMICSLRGASHNVLDILKKSLVGVDGIGGGHEKACGCNILESDFERFVENVKRQL